MTIERPSDAWTSGDPQHNHVPRERMAEATARGLGLLGLAMGALPAFVANGVLVEKTSDMDIRDGRRKYAPGPSTIPGGWREVAIRRERKLMRLNVVHPMNLQVGGRGHVDVEIAEPRLVGTAVMAGASSSVKVDMDEANIPHVSGIEAGVKYNVDTPNPKSGFADISWAEYNMGSAEEGLPQLAALPTPPAPQP